MWENSRGLCTAAFVNEEVQPYIELPITHSYNTATNRGAKDCVQTVIPPARILLG